MDHYLRRATEAYARAPTRWTWAIVERALTGDTTDLDEQFLTKMEQADALRSIREARTKRASAWRTGRLARTG